MREDGGDKQRLSPVGKPEIPKLHSYHILVLHSENGNLPTTLNSLQGEWSLAQGKSLHREVMTSFKLPILAMQDFYVVWMQLWN